MIKQTGQLTDWKCVCCLGCVNLICQIDTTFWIIRRGFFYILQPLVATVETNDLILAHMYWERRYWTLCHMDLPVRTHINTETDWILKSPPPQTHTMASLEWCDITWMQLVWFQEGHRETVTLKYAQNGQNKSLPTWKSESQSQAQNSSV